jgi:hypothetical protein
MKKLRDWSIVQDAYRSIAAQEIDDYATAQRRMRGFIFRYRARDEKIREARGSLQ